MKVRSFRLASISKGLDFGKRAPARTIFLWLLALTFCLMLFYLYDNQLLIGASFLLVFATSRAPLFSAVLVSMVASLGFANYMKNMLDDLLILSLPTFAFGLLESAVILPWFLWPLVVFFAFAAKLAYISNIHPLIVDMKMTSLVVCLSVPILAASLMNSDSYSTLWKAYQWKDEDDTTLIDDFKSAIEADESYRIRYLFGYLITYRRDPDLLAKIEDSIDKTQNECYQYEMDNALRVALHLDALYDNESISAHFQAQMHKQDAFLHTVLALQRCCDN